MSMRWVEYDHEKVPIFMDKYSIHGCGRSMSTMQHRRDPEDLARGTWMQTVIDEHKDWIGLTVTQEGDTKALDYCAVTGFMSHALAPYVNKIIGVGLSKNMTVQYAKIAEQTLDDHPNCLMISVRGDMIRPDPDPIGIPSDYIPFDIVAKCGGMLLVLEVDKEYEAGGEHKGEDEDYEAKCQHSMRSSKKIVSYGSREIYTVLDALGMADIEVKDDLWSEEPSNGGQIYFLLKATKRDKYHEPAAENVEA